MLYLHTEKKFIQNIMLTYIAKPTLCSLSGFHERICFLTKKSLYSFIQVLNYFAVTLLPTLLPTEEGGGGGGGGGGDFSHHSISCNSETT